MNTLLKKRLKKEVIGLVSDLTSSILMMKGDIHGLKKELPKMFHKRTEKLIRQLEKIAAKGENKLNSLVAQKINPVLDMVEDWLQKTSQLHARQKSSTGKSKKRKTKKTASSSQKSSRRRTKKR